MENDPVRDVFSIDNRGKSKGQAPLVHQRYDDPTGHPRPARHNKRITLSSTTFLIYRYYQYLSKSKPKPKPKPGATQTHMVSHPFINAIPTFRRSLINAIPIQPPLNTSHALHAIPRDPDRNTLPLVTKPQLPHPTRQNTMHCSSAPWPTCSSASTHPARYSLPTQHQHTLPARRTC